MLTCFVTPWRLAFYFEDEEPWMWVLINLSVDAGFGLDILVNFNSAYEDKDLTLHTSRKQIADNYLRTWFFIDLIATVPFNLIMDQNNISETSLKGGFRAFRLYKLMKLTRLLRILKVIKDKKKL